LFNLTKSQAGQDLFVTAMTQGLRHGQWLELGCGDPICSSNTYFLEKHLGWSGISIDQQRMDTDIITPFEEYWQGFYRTIRAPSWPVDPVPPQDVPDSQRLENMSYYENFIKRQITDIDAIPRDQRSWHTARPRTDFRAMDARDLDLSTILGHVDYLQIDVHPSMLNLEMLEKVLPVIRFSVITFEHDAWDHTAESQHVRLASRELLREHGYVMVISDVTVPPGHGNGIGDEPINFEDWWVDPDFINSDIIALYQDLRDHGDPKYYFHTLFRDIE
jgi:hypothetical protein